MMRRQAILTALDQAGSLSVGELSKQFNVSEVTVRQDLQALYEQNLLVRTRGGAVTIQALPELSFDVRMQQRSDEKARIGKAAAQMIRPGDSVVMDASTTVLAMLPFIKNIPELTIITNSLKVGINLLRMPQIQVIMPGGILRRDAISLVSPPENEFFKGLHVRIGFFGARGITLEQGLTEIDLEEARTKRRLAEICQNVTAVLDGSKWGQMAVVTFAELSAVQCVITGSSAPVDLVETVRKHGVDVVTV